MGKGIFITGTGTCVGKSLVTGLLARYCLEIGKKAVTQKWIQTGYMKDNTDLDAHFAIMGCKPKDFEPWIDDMVPYKFSLPASPHLAAKMEHTTIDKSRIIKAEKRLAKAFDCVLVEGSGGLLVPFTEKEMVIDIVQELQLPVIVVAQNILGAINHTLLTIDVLKSRKLKILGLIFTQTHPGEDIFILKDNLRIISEFTQVPVLADLPYSQDINLLYDHIKESKIAELINKKF
ncbi:dethiobiotin synthase [Thermoproteota archaeon]